ncbi:beta-galactosidase [Flavobacterium sp. KMS]|uniref:glycoside hydrolase family 2 TIM barrel-domain containing protein n=1 Tax=Flavobacterium sp. KMS TaxID=1566023 RepID=UPI00057FF309|nr:glycoside hydrolase family 2 TIM barrel-domain containing protein [Flavobacterium sp. KMS]KIA94416.1 beta-galactosidase [Flavobacterium sp. KMS]
MKKSIVVAFLSCFVFISQANAQTKSILNFDVPVLTPFASAVDGVSVANVSLNGNWGFDIKEQPQKTKGIQVPGEWEMQGYSVSEGQTALYTKRLNIPADWKGKQIKIRFDAVSSHALVKINGKTVGEHEGSFVPFEVDITNELSYKEDILVVEVQALTISDRMACTSQYACHTVGGLLRKVTLFAVAPLHISAVTINTTFDASYKDASLIIENTVTSNLTVPANAKLEFTLLDAVGKVVSNKTSTFSNKIGPNSDNDIKTVLAIKTPRHWDSEHPYLYKLKTVVLVNGIKQQTNEQNVGFRQIVIKGNEFFVNGKPIKLRGVNRHSIHPLTGRSISTTLERKDAELFKQANCNYIRTSHYPPSEEFLNAADELGLFVESESSLNWIEHHASPIWKLWSYTDEKFLLYMVRANMDNILAGRNHPSIIIWSLGNESRWSPLWVKVNAVVKQMDKSRPTSFHDQCWGTFNNAGSKADVANIHYPGINGPKVTDTISRPTLFGEYAHLSTYNRRELVTDPGVRSAYSEPLVQFYDSIYKHKGNLGGAIWSGIDDIFHMPDGRIVGYGPWGPLDAWRRTKPEYYGVKKAYSPVRITNVNWATLSKGYVELKMENRYDFTSFKELKIEVKTNGISKLISSAIPARGEGILRIPVDKNEQGFYISFKDSSGFIVNEEKYENGTITELEDKKVPLSFSENESAITVNQGEISYLINKITGVITNVKKNNQTIMTQGPVFCLIPMNSEDGGKPNVAGETYQNNIYPIKNYPLYTLFATDLTVKQTKEGIVIDMKTTYTDVKGKQSYLFTNNGKLETTYEVEYGDVDLSPYQYGMLVQLPKQFEQLSWKRKGEFTIYPENDIARNEGTTMLNAKHVNGVEEVGVVPNGDWKDDTNDLGSNDFRSTKRHIKSAVLQDKTGNSIKVLSDGTQASRSWLQDEHIQWLIADYSNTGSEPFYGTPHSSGRIKTKGKTLKGKMTLEIK